MYVGRSLGVDGEILVLCVKVSENKIPTLLLTLLSEIIIISNNVHAPRLLSNYQQNDDNVAENNSNVI